MIQVENILIEHLVTEKATAALSNQNQYTFRVAKNTNQIAIRQAIESRFGVKVHSVQTLNVKPKAKRDRMRRGQSGLKPGYKKAIVRLQAGDTIDIA
ncbi:MAG: 50S ribosomal protein L23 [Opitutales bacterium]|nr:50S ribosomal protein L23 [Opitutales bacterium]